MTDLSLLKKKLGVYSAMAAGVLAMASEKSAGQIVYHDVIPDQYLEPNGDYYLDFNNDSIFDFQFHESFSSTDYGSTGEGSDRVFMLNGNSFLAYSFYAEYNGFPVALNLSSFIGVSCGTSYCNYWRNGVGMLRDFGFGTGSYGGWFNSDGPFADKSNVYLGVILKEADGNHYGWIRLDDGRKIKDYAYQLIPDSSILAGQQCDIPVITELGDSALICTDALTFQWLLNGSPILGATDQIYIPAQSGAYQVQISNSNGTTATSDTFFYCNNLVPEISSSHPCICDSPPLPLNVSNGGISVQWFYNEAAIAGATSSAYNAYNTGEYFAVVNSIACPDTSQTFTLTYCPDMLLPIVNRDADTLYSSYPENNQWWLTNTIIPGATGSSFIMTISGTYRVNVLADTNGCAVGFSDAAYFETCTELLTLSVIANPDIDTICEGESVELISNHPGDSGPNQWYLDGSLIAGATSYHYYPDSTGDYYLVHRNYWECIYTSDTFSLLVINVIPPVISQLGDSALSSSFSLNYQWLLNSLPISGATNQIYFPVQSGAYQVQVTDTNGCTAISETIFFSATKAIEPSDNIFVTTFLTHDQLTIHLDPSLMGSELLLYDVPGNLKHQLTPTTNTVILSVKNFASGIYFLRLTKADKQWTKKICIE